MSKDKECFIGQKAFIEKDGKLLVLLNDRGGVDFPGGKLQEDETDLDQSLRREVREETGVEIDIGRPLFRWLFTFTRGDKAGKEVFLVGISATITSGEITLSDEHTGYRWVDKDSYQELAGKDHDHFPALAQYFIRK